MQFRPDRADVEGSWRRVLKLTEQAAQVADLVVLPEMAMPGYVFEGPDEVRPWASAPDGPRPAALAGLAKAHGAWIVAGLPESDGDELYNSAWVYDGCGVRRAIYRKTLLFELDETWATAGRGDYPVLQTPWGRLGVGICMDLNDERFVAWLVRSRIDVLAFPTNWLDQGDSVWPYWLWRLRACGAVLVAANRWGSEAGVRFRGESAILGASRVHASAGTTGDALVVADLPSLVSESEAEVGCGIWESD